ncbi:glycosyltransferase family 4 protein [Pleomorphovibrio marinus]|uniref:glycosyltransferase family 4 protein n=1 Tax=Pleomorphovibrio marinus TaxID=2164132 RepID=UPI000E0A1044|nr:glycosyltransferase family 4 protein [Pleomorphovibrio marinus]
MIVYISSINTAFVSRDLEMLKGVHKTVHLTFTDKPFLLPFFFLIQFAQLLFLLPFTSKYLCFFSGYHTLIPVVLGKTFGKKVIIQCGGTDAMHLPHINYGNYRKKWLKLATIFSFKHCSLIVPVSEALVKSNYTYDPVAPSSQGLLNLIPNLKTEITVIHNGFDSGFWKDETEKKPFTFVTVATGISKENRALVKGIDLLIASAKKFEDFTFIIIGDGKFKVDLANVEVKPTLNQVEIKRIFQYSQFYLQLSSSEGFPNALAEAMLCGCIPIGTKVGEIPNIIADTGFIVEKKEINLLIEIFEGLSDKNLQGLRKKASKRIKTLFSYEHRKDKLLRILAV